MEVRFFRPSIDFFLNLNGRLGLPIVAKRLPLINSSQNGRLIFFSLRHLDNFHSRAVKS